MTLRTRRILYVTCILIFLIAAPLLTLYTAGFRFDFKYKRLVETGSIVVKSRPAGASVVLAGKTHPDKTPLIINNIPPGRVSLQVSKEGYHYWQQEITVKPRVTTFAENIRLFPSGGPKTILATSTLAYWWNRKQDKLIYESVRSQLRLLNTLNNKDELLVKLRRNEGVEILWSPHDEQFILIKKNGGNAAYWLGDAAAVTKLRPLAQITKKKITKLAWDPNMSNSLYLLSAGALWRLSVPLRNDRLVATGPIIDWRAEAKRILLLEKSANKNNGLLSLLDLSKPSGRPTRLLTVPAAGQKFLASNSRRLALYNEPSRTLLIVDPLLRSEGRSDAITTLSPVLETQWSQDGQRLIYSDGYGIYEHYFPQPAAEPESAVVRRLILRYSTPVANIFLMTPDEGLLLYSVNNSLRVIELTSEPEPQTTVLLENIKTIKSPHYLSGPEILNFIDPAGQLLALPLSASETGTGFFGGQ